MLKLSIKRLRQNKQAFIQCRAKMPGLGFTLIELLVVIAIIGLLSTIAVASLSSSREKARIAKGQQFSGSIRSGMGYSIVGEWNFNEGSGVTAKDTSGYENDGTIAVGTSWITDEDECMNGACLLFDGIDDSVVIADDDSLNNSIFTIEAWVKPISYHVGGANSNIVMAREHYLNTGFRFGVTDTGQLRFWTTQSGGTLQVYADTAISIDSFYHFVVSYDGSIAKMYINGDEVAVNTGTYFSPVGQSLGICGGTGGVQWFNGLIDEVRIYSAALSLGQIQQNYAEGLERHRDLARAE